MKPLVPRDCSSEASSRPIFPRRHPRFSRFSRLRGHHVVRSWRPFLSVFWIPSPLATVTAAVTSPRDVACTLDDRVGFPTGVPALSCLPCGLSSKERPAESSPILREARPLLQRLLRLLRTEANAPVPPTGPLNDRRHPTPLTSSPTPHAPAHGAPASLVATHPSLGTEALLVSATGTIVPISLTWLGPP